MDYNELLLDEHSDKIDNIIDINITLKSHQLAMVKKCLEIENLNISGFGIMSDKPGTGKTFVILSLIFLSKKKINIIIVPQNIILQWCDAIDNFSNGLLKYKKIIDYSDILELYNEKTDLLNNDILITTSLYYNVIATTLKSNFLFVERVFFDEIDSISNFVVSNVNANFIWFISATVNKKLLGIYTNKIDEEFFPYITCKCKDNFIDYSFSLENPNVYKIICKNFYLDNIFNNIVSNEEFKVLNAMDYSKLKKKFCNRIAQNEKEALDFLIKDKLDIIEIETMRIDDLKKAIEKSNDINKTELFKKELEESEKSLNDGNNKLLLIRERLKDNNCCPLCYNEFELNKNRTLSPCCKNIICFDCTDRWFNKMDKKNCIYCNLENINFEDYVILKSISENKCILCDKEYLSKDEEYYSNCCNKKCCKNCLNDWYHKLFKKNCLFCFEDHILFEDFKNHKEYDEMKLNINSGVKYTNKTKIEFLEYFIRTKIYSNCKIIFCSNYTRIFNNIKKLFEDNFIHYIELDDGNIDSINQSIRYYTLGNTNVLLLNSNLFGCGLNLECTTDIVFLHKTDEDLEKQIIGRAQRPGRKNKLNIWNIMHENENIIINEKNNEQYYNNSLYDNLLNNLEITNIYNYNTEDDKITKII